MVQHNNPIRVEDRIYTMGNGDDSAIFEHAASQSCLQHSVRFDVNRCRCFIEDENIGRCKESSSEADQLALTRRKVGACNMSASMDEFRRVMMGIPPSCTVASRPPGMLETCSLSLAWSCVSISGP